MIDISKLPLVEEVLQRPQEVIVRWRQVRIVRRTIQRLLLQFNQLPHRQFDDMQPCDVLKQVKIAATVTGADCSGPVADSSALRLSSLQLAANFTESARHDIKR
ncbi:hypothetical protein KIN20_032627 [Parelaphostrongylus tenuis]|uniref:Uncharacterized protein n=1 Tax=Parelaphostrongylus tenuis TaxID=148309 RepID=A0AAD5WHM6_PARTN|nr:hypothetical protein KIN20_032627 [Parelaphostrongylus tenuis]